MPDREKVISEFEDFVKSFSKRDDTYYKELFASVLALLKEQEETINELQNAYSYLQKQFFEVQDKLLKEQEAVKPRVSSVEQRCGNCNKIIEMDGWQSCPWCGKRIDWKEWWKKNGTRNQDS